MYLAASGVLFRYLAAKMCHLVLFLSIFNVLLAAAIQIDPAVTIRCLLQKDFQKPCNLQGGRPVPSHLIQIYQELPTKTRTKLESNCHLRNLTTEEYALVHPSFWLLSSVERLSKFPGSKLSSILLDWPSVSCVAAQIMNSLRTTDQKKEFIDKLNPRSGLLSERVQSVISSTLITWHENEWDLPVLVHNANSLLLHFPAEHLLTSTRTRSSERLLFFVSSWEGFGDDGKWMEQPPIVRRKVAHAFLSKSHKNISEWTDAELMKFIHLIPGMTAEELSFLDKNINISSEAQKNILNMGGLDIQQIRTLFDVFYSKARLTKYDFANLLQVVAKLSPNQLNKFNNIKKLNLEKVNAGSSMKELAGLKQLLQMSIASNVLNHNRSMDVSEWGDEIKYLGPLIAALPLHELKHFSNHSFDELSLFLFDYPMINFVQAYYLTQNGTIFNSMDPKLFTERHYLVQALPSSTIIRNSNNKDKSTKSWSTLLGSLAGDNLPRFILMFKKTVEDMGLDNALESLLRSVDNYEMLSALPSRTLQHIVGSLNSDLEKFQDIISLLPKKLMAMVLNVNRSGPWTWDNFINKKYLNSFLVGLTCSDVHNIETSDFPLIMSEFNRQRISAGQVFSKDLQLCCLHKLMKYLEMKSKLLQSEPNEGLMSLLEPGEIEALGGYILSALPPKAISSSNYRYQILKLIGQLSVPELMIGMSETQRSEIINIFFVHHGLNVDPRSQIDESHLFHMGNLTLFLPSEAVKRIKPEALKLLLEINFIDKRVCADNNTRSEWASLIRLAFGEPSEWKKERVTIIGDFLLVASDSDLLQVKEESMRGAGVSLTNNFNEMIDWIPEDTEYYKACISTLNEDEKSLYMSDLKKLVRWQLRAVQLELNTIKSAKEIIEKEALPILKSPLERPLKFNYSMKFLQQPQKPAIHEVDSTSGSRTHEDLKIFDSKIESLSGQDSLKPMGEGLLTTASPPSTLQMEEVTQRNHDPDADDSNMKVYPINFANNPLNSHNDSHISSASKKAETEVQVSQTNKVVEDNMKTTEMKTQGLIPQVVRETADSGTAVDLENGRGPRRLSFSGGRPFNNDTSQNESIPVSTTMQPLLNNNTTTQKPSSEAVTQSFTATTHKMSKTEKEDQGLMKSMKFLFPVPDFWSAVNSLNKDTSSQHKKTPQNEATTLNSSVSINSSHIPDPEKIIVSENRTQESVQKRSLGDIYDKSVHPDTLIVEDALLKGAESDDEDDYDEDTKDIRRRSVVVDSSMDGKGNETVHEDVTISCDSLRIVGDISKLAFEETDLEKFTDLEVENCLDVFRAMELPLDLKIKILKRIKKDELNLLGSLLQGIQVQDLEKMNFRFDKPWVLETLSHLSSFPPEEKTINFILEKVNEHNSGYQIGPEILISLKGLICHMNSKDRNAMLLTPMRKPILATSVLGQIDNCSSECLTDLARFAREEGNFGDPKTYNAEDILSLGVIAAGFNNEDWKNILENDGSSISGLHSSAVKCMSKEKLEIIPEDIFHLIPYKTLIFLESTKNSSLKENQKLVLSKILNENESWEEKLLSKSNGDNSELDPSLQEASYTSLYIAILLFILIVILVYIFCRMRSTEQ